MAMTNDVESPSPPSSTGSSRKLRSWIDGYIELTEGISSPEIFRRWAAVSTIAGVLERKVWVRTNKSLTYPHLYILLVGGPGVGKTEAIRTSIDFLRELPDAHLAPTSVSRASLIDALAAAERTIVRPGDLKPVVSYNSLNICATEFGAFLTAYEGEFMSTLNDLYDNLRYEERKRHMRKGEPLIIAHPQLNLIAGTTPGWLVSNLPQQAWSEGFASRLILVYGKGIMLSDPFADTHLNASLKAALHSDLEVIHGLYGEVRFSPAAKEAYTKWYLNGQAPVPAHPKLEHYLPRRARQMLKLCMAISVARTDTLIVSLEDYEAAAEMLFAAEREMPYIFREMNTGGDSSILAEVYMEVNRLFIRDQRPIPEYMIKHFIAKRVPAYGVAKVFEVLVDTHMVKAVGAVGPGGRPVYAPVPPKDHNTA